MCRQMRCTFKEERCQCCLIEMPRCARGTCAPSSRQVALFGHSGHRLKGALSRPGGSSGPCSAFKVSRARLSVHQAGEVGGSSQQGLQSLGAFCMGTVLRHVLLLQKDIQKAARFYNEGLSLPILALTDRWAEFGAGSSKIAMKSVEG